MIQFVLRLWFPSFLPCGRRRRRRAVPRRHNDDNRNQTNVRVFLQAETIAGQSIFLHRNRAGVLPMGGNWDGAAGEEEQKKDDSTEYSSSSIAFLNMVPVCRTSLPLCCRAVLLLCRMHRARVSCRGFASLPAWERCHFFFF